MADQGLEAKAEFGMTLDVVDRKAAPARASRDSTVGVDLHSVSARVVLLQDQRRTSGYSFRM